MRRSGSFIGILASFALVLSLGCEGMQSTIGPEQPAAPQLHTQDLGFSTDGLLTFLQPDLTLSRHAGGLISAAAGGSVELGGFRVDIPAGALDRDTYVTIDLPLGLPEAGYILADFGPSGTRFTKPVTITLPLQGADLAGIDLSTVKVSYWNGSSWENYGGAATSSSVSSTTSHFSTYGARSSSGGIDTTSGG
jgi:hypothetical protein